MMRTDMVLETLVDSPFNHMTQVLAQEYFVESSCCESFKLENTEVHITSGETYVSFNRHYLSINGGVQVADLVVYDDGPLCVIRRRRTRSRKASSRGPTALSR
jgi:hypothetical protein